MGDAAWSTIGSVIFADDGSILVHQSWMDTFLDCPERARRELIEPRTEEGDAASCGTAAHAAIEAVIKGTIGPEPMAIAAAARDEARRLLDTTNIVFKSMETSSEMIEMAARMPPRLKLRGLKRKYVLKRALEGVLSKDVVWRRKAGFGAPIRSWLRGPLRPLISDLLSEDVVKRRGLFRPNEVKRVIDANFSGREDYNLHVFQLLGLELWHQTFIDSTPD